MKFRESSVSIGRQMALLVAGTCLVASLSLVALGSYSSRHVQMSQQDAFGTALAERLAQRINQPLASGDLLDVAASLQQFVETSSAEQVTLFDVEGKALGVAGEADEQAMRFWRAPVTIDDNIAGEVQVALAADPVASGQRQLIASLLGLAVLLSVGVYALTGYYGRRLATYLHGQAERLSLDSAETRPNPSVDNELRLLEKRIDALPLELLRAVRSTGSDEEQYNSTAVLYIQLHSLENYVDTLDERLLHRYISQLHQVVCGAAGFYGGHLQVVRQFGLALYFSGEHSAGSPVRRAGLTAWLVGELCREMENYLPLSVRCSQAVDLSELGPGSARDLYPGLYMQHTLDQLHLVCASKPPRVLFSPDAAEDASLQRCAELAPTEVHAYSSLERFDEQHTQLLERQLRLVWSHLKTQDQ